MKTGSDTTTKEHHHKAGSWRVNLAALRTRNSHIYGSKRSEQVHLETSAVEDDQLQTGEWRQTGEEQVRTVERSIWKPVNWRSGRAGGRFKFISIMIVDCAIIFLVISSLTCQCVGPIWAVVVAVVLKFVSKNNNLYRYEKD